jgi:hypothetical protein
MTLNSEIAYHSVVFDLLSDELVFTERVARLASEAVHWTLVDLLLNRSVEQEERLTHALLGRERRRVSEAAGKIMRAETQGPGEGL